MGYMDIANRENIDDLIAKTLSAQFHTKVTVDTQYRRDAFILCPRLNRAIMPCASGDLKRAIRVGHAVHKSLFLHLAMDWYIRLAYTGLARLPIFHSKYIHFEKLPEHARDLLIMPGNMRIKVFDYREQRILNLVKEGFPVTFVDTERMVRSQPIWDFVLPMVDLRSTAYWETMITGVSIDRLHPRERAGIEHKVQDILYEMQQKDREVVVARQYAGQLREGIARLLQELSGQQMGNTQEGSTILDLTNVLENAISEDEVILSASHGDFQNGNIFCSEEGRITVLDWETYGKRSLGYDILTYFYQFRYRRDFPGRIQQYLKAENWAEISTRYYGRATDKRQILCIYFLEDLIWLLNESLQTPEKRMTDSLKQYADATFREALEALL